MAEAVGQPLEVQQRNRGAATAQAGGRVARERGEREAGADSDHETARAAGLVHGDRRPLLGVGSAQQLVERDARVGDVVQPVLRIAFEAAGEQPAQLPGKRRGQRLPVDLLPQHGREHVADGLAGEELPPGQHLVEEDAEGPDVRTLVDGPSASLLGGHVGRGAQDEPGRGAGVGERGGLRQVRRRGSRPFPRFRETEVEDLHLAVRRQLHVRGLEVAVDDALLVRLLERLGDLPRDWQRLVRCDRSPLQPLGEVLALDQLHGDQVNRRAIAKRGRLEAIELCDVRVVERGEQLRLALEAREPVGVGGERGGQQLQSHLAAEPRVRRAVDLAHAAGADRPDDLVRPEALSRRDGHVCASVLAARGAAARRGS